ncbi:energy transducer TonB [Hymenobacter sp. BT635]|uniref:Energy transducer TonB n=1 Tax=Hymenobacter nitidus TaxID=2880929 RepID=A0ABS8AEP0_9BACT|nr:energy transducer TonB [Hymenobacter nitidus]MCB2378427.1 energy transducer TonB [Hymenobacter nitidus]
MLDLPLLNVRLNPCHEDWQQMTPTAQGRHCASCQRTVHDFTTATQADLMAARAASADGRLCGRFRQAQLAPAQPQLRPKLRRFLVALVLVCGLGLSSGEAWAQVRKAELNTRAVPPAGLQLKRPEELSPVSLTDDVDQLLAPAGPTPERMVFVGSVEQMPQYPGGMDALIAYLGQNTRYPDSVTASGKVFVSFLLTKTGAITNVRITRGVNPALDAEALRVVQQMPPWLSGEQNNLPVDVSYTMPITFSREPDTGAHKQKGKRRAAGR